MAGEYYFITVSIITVLIYLFTYFLSKLKIMSDNSHKKIWNVILLVSFLVMAFCSIFLVLRASYGISIALPFSLFFWHVESGIIFIISSFFHIIYHMDYYLLIFKKN
jgi:hypothetical protein